MISLVKRWRRRVLRVWDRLRNPVYSESSAPFLSVDLWTEFADLVIFDRDSGSRLERVLRKKSNPVIFIETGVASAYYCQLSRSDSPFRLITAGNDDPSVPHIHEPPRDLSLVDSARKLLDCPALVRWYTKNPGIIHPKLQGLPLGPKWQWKTQRFFGESKAVHATLFRELGLQPNERFRDLSAEKTGLLYFNFGGTTDDPFFEVHRGVRATLKEQLSKRFPWTPSEPFEDYLRTLSRFQFSLSPPGRGLDTHRTWESLMVGTVPIVLTSPLDPLFRSLPVVIVEDWSVLTEEFLRRTREQLLKQSYSFEICYRNYWEQEFRVGTEGVR